MASAIRFTTYFTDVATRKAGSRIFVSKVALALLGNPEALEVSGNLKDGIVLSPAKLVTSDAGRIERGSLARRVYQTPSDWAFIMDGWRLTGLDDKLMARTREVYDVSAAVSKEQITIAPMDLSQGDRLTREVHARTKGRQQKRRTAAIRAHYAKPSDETAPRPAPVPQKVRVVAANGPQSISAMQDAMHVINAAVRSGFKLARNAEGTYRLVIE